MHRETSKLFSKLSDREFLSFIRNIVSSCVTMLLFVFLLFIPYSVLVLLCQILIAFLFILSFTLCFYHYKNHKVYKEHYLVESEEESKRAEKCPYFIDSDGTEYFGQ